MHTEGYVLVKNNCNIPHTVTGDQFWSRNLLRSLSPYSIIWIARYNGPDTLYYQRSSHRRSTKHTQASSASSQTPGDILDRMKSWSNIPWLGQDSTNRRTVLSSTMAQTYPVRLKSLATLLLHRNYQDWGDPRWSFHCLDFGIFNIAVYLLSLF